MSGGGGGEVLEGFLCPLCMKDLGDVIQLQVATTHLISHLGQLYLSKYYFRCTLMRPILKKIRHLFRI